MHILDKSSSSYILPNRKSIHTNYTYHTIHAVCNHSRMHALQLHGHSIHKCNRIEAYKNPKSTHNYIQYIHIYIYIYIYHANEKHHKDELQLKPFNPTEQKYIIHATLFDACGFGTVVAVMDIIDSQNGFVDRTLYSRASRIILLSYVVILFPISNHTFHDL